MKAYVLPESTPGKLQHLTIFIVSILRGLAVWAWPAAAYCIHSLSGASGHAAGKACGCWSRLDHRGRQPSAWPASWPVSPSGQRSAS